jgi:hypothetical protein
MNTVNTVNTVLLHIRDYRIQLLNFNRFRNAVKKM